MRPCYGKCHEAIHVYLELNNHYCNNILHVLPAMAYSKCTSNKVSSLERSGSMSHLLNAPCLSVRRFLQVYEALAMEHANIAVYALGALGVFKCLQMKFQNASAVHSFLWSLHLMLAKRLWLSCFLILWNWRDTMSGEKVATEILKRADCLPYAHRGRHTPHDGQILATGPGHTYHYGATSAQRIVGAFIVRLRYECLIIFLNLKAVQTQVEMSKVQ